VRSAREIAKNLARQIIDGGYAGSGDVLPVRDILEQAIIAARLEMRDKSELLAYKHKQHDLADAIRTLNPEGDA
jgi:hypothetical protein